MHRAHRRRAFARPPPLVSARASPYGAADTLRILLIPAFARITNSVLRQIKKLLIQEFFYLAIYYLISVNTLGATITLAPNSVEAFLYVYVP